MKTSIAQIGAALRSNSIPEKAVFFPKFFKTGKGQYGEGDKFLGVTVPAQRIIAKQYIGLPLAEIEELLFSQWHEERLTALLIMVETLHKNKPNLELKKQYYEFYLEHAKNVNNWDLVDASCRDIVGEYLLTQPEAARQVLVKLANSTDLWERRIAMISTWAFIRAKESTWTYKIADILIVDKHDLIQKAVGWMLREAGKKVSMPELKAYLQKNHNQLGRTTLRYALERFPEKDRKRYLSGDYS